MQPLLMVTDRSLADPVAATAAFVEAAPEGLCRVQLREKDLGASELAALARKLLAILHARAGKLFINDRTDVALSVGADGVHLPESGLSPREVRSLVPSSMEISVSAHSVDGAVARSEHADAVVFGPVFDTPKKRRFGAPRGLQELSAVARDAKCPVYGIGGVDAQTVSRVAAAGAQGAGAIRAFTGTQLCAVKSWLDAFC